MEQEKYTVKAIAALKGWTYAEMAQHTGIKARRLKNLNAGSCSMLARELYAISNATGVQPDMIAYR